MTSISERLIEGVQGALIGAIAGPICFTPVGLLCYYINKKITHIPYIKSLHNPVFASLPFQKVLKVIALTSAIYVAFWYAYKRLLILIMSKVHKNKKRIIF